MFTLLSCCTISNRAIRAQRTNQPRGGAAHDTRGRANAYLLPEKSVIETRRIDGERGRNNELASYNTIGATRAPRSRADQLRARALRKSASIRRLYRASSRDRMIPSLSPLRSPLYFLSSAFSSLLSSSSSMENRTNAYLATTRRDVGNYA